GPNVLKVRNMVVSADGKRLAVAVPFGKPQEAAAAGGRDAAGSSGMTPMEIWLYELPSLRGLRHLGGGPQADDVLAFSPDGRYLFAPDTRNHRRLLLQWDLASGRSIRQYPLHAGPITAVAFTPD